MGAKAGIAAWGTFLRRKEVKGAKKEEDKNRDPNKDDRTSIADCKRSLTFLHQKKKQNIAINTKHCMSSGAKGKQSHECAKRNRRSNPKI